MSSSVSLEYLNNLITSNGSNINFFNDNTYEYSNCLCVMRRAYGNIQVAFPTIISSDKIAILGVKTQYYPTLAKSSVITRGFATVLVEDNQTIHNGAKLKLSSVQPGRVIEDSSISPTDPLYVGQADIGGDVIGGIDQTVNVFLAR